METKTVLEKSRDIFTLVDLIRKVAAHKGLKLHEGASKAYSEPIKEYVLDGRLLAILAERGIRRQPRPDCNNGIFTLVDENPQERVLGLGFCASNYWNFKPVEGDDTKFNLRISLCVGFMLNTQERGIVLLPLAHGSFLSPCDRLPNFRMFKALVESDSESSAVAKEIAASEGSIVVTWTNLGLGGIRRLSDLFFEFVGQSKETKQLGMKGEVFDPNPFPQYQQPGNELFITEPAQPRIIKIWRAQLEEYRNSLVAV